MTDRSESVERSLFKRILSGQGQTRAPQIILALIVALVAAWVLVEDRPDESSLGSSGAEDEDQALSLSVVPASTFDGIALPDGIAIALRRTPDHCWRAEVSMFMFGDPEADGGDLVLHLPSDARYVKPERDEGGGAVAAPGLGLRFDRGGPGVGCSGRPHGPEQFGSRVVARIAIEPAARFGTVDFADKGQPPRLEHFGTIVTAFEWPAGPSTRKLGLGRELFQFRYVRFVPEISGVDGPGRALVDAGSIWRPPHHLEELGADLLRDQRPRFSISYTLADVDERFVDLVPQADSGTTLSRTWSPPRSADDLVIEGTVENDYVRTWVDIARNALFLFLGAIIGWVPHWRRRGVVAGGLRGVGRGAGATGRLLAHGWSGLTVARRRGTLSLDPFDSGLAAVCGFFAALALLGAGALIDGANGAEWALAFAVLLAPVTGAAVLWQARGVGASVMDAAAAGGGSAAAIGLTALVVGEVGAWDLIQIALVVGASGALVGVAAALALRR